ncbi:response regulator transcription factor [Iodobacter fluviatilis]|uniref:DNA-binding response regulator n=1 Tax=Iodobacter fluviatilis TaxID=537 RepID=A0A7G3GDA0_9NEIS|nr:response regulator transcription factor [Iodobacter fluviatilis]QBC45296.1 DNA-binding response regulator [Iodobacter fluviatilis]
MTKVLIVDDHPVVRLAVKMLLEQSGFDVVGEADNGVDAWQLAQSLVPDVLVLDLAIPNLDGFEVIARIQKSKLPIRVMVFSSGEAEQMVQRCMRAGASGYLGKDKEITDLVDAIKMIMKGVGYFPNQSFLVSTGDNLLQSEHQMLNSLSNREMMIMQQLLLGKSNKEMAADMLLSPKTVSTYKLRIFTKLGIGSLTDLINMVSRNTPV